MRFPRWLPIVLACTAFPACQGDTLQKEGGFCGFWKTLQTRVRQGRIPDDMTAFPFSLTGVADFYPQIDLPRSSFRKLGKEILNAEFIDATGRLTTVKAFIVNTSCPVCTPPDCQVEVMWFVYDGSWRFKGLSAEDDLFYSVLDRCRKQRLACEIKHR